MNESSQKKVERNLDKIRDMSLREIAEDRIEHHVGVGNEMDYYSGDFGEQIINPPFTRDDVAIAFVQALLLEMQWLLAPAKEDDK